MHTAAALTLQIACFLQADEAAPRPPREWVLIPGHGRRDTDTFAGAVARRAARADPVLRTLLVTLCLLMLPATRAHAQAVVRKDAPADARSERSGTWSARSTTGLTLGGTWTAVPDSTGGTVTGTWTLADASGGTRASGAWSAAWTPALRSGDWRAVVTGRDGELAGTFTSSVPLGRNAPFADLFARAARDAVGGGWRMGGLTGAWSVRAAH